MFQPALDLIRREYSGLAAKEYVAQISRYHRIQASPGYRQAAAYVAGELARWGLAVATHCYPARFDQFFWSAGMFQEWDCQAATLHLIAPQAQAVKLADFREVPISVIQRSSGVDGEFAVVAVDGGTKPEDYAGLDVRGKLVLTRAAVEGVRRVAVEQLGAAGVLFDGMNPVPPTRQPGDLPDVRQYTSWWWTGHETPCFGFVLTPRQGAWLRDILKQGEVRVRAQVDARLYAGEIEVVDAWIPGETDDEIVVTSHLCHPAPGANDNGSGAAANMEAARTLATLIARGELPRPRRTLRFLWMPEMTGTYAYLATHEGHIPHMVAGLNLDMVGADQEAVGSVMVIDSPPQAMPSFTLDLIERLRDEFTHDQKSFSSQGGYALFRYTTVPFSGGSDHYILSDPTVGIPCPMIIEWPDRYYHTSHDSLEKVSPVTLARNGGLAATYAYWLASAGADETRWLGEEMTSRAKGRILALLRETVGAARAGSQDAQASRHGDGQEDGQARGQANGHGSHKGHAYMADKLAYRLDRERLNLASLRRLDTNAPIDAWQADLARFAASETKALETRLLGESGALEISGNGFAPPESAALMRVPRRLMPGPVDFRAHLHKLSAEEQGRLHQQNTLRTSTTLALYWADGQRSIADIARYITLETGQPTPPDGLVELFELLAKMELVSL